MIIDLLDKNKLKIYKKTKFMKFIFLILSLIILSLSQVKASNSDKKAIFSHKCNTSLINLINKKDPTNFTKLRTLGVKRLRNWDNKKYEAFVFRAAYDRSHNIEIRVHVNFKTKARGYAMKYAKMAGQIPNFLRRYMRTIIVFPPDPEAPGPAYAWGNNIAFHTNYFQGSCGEEVLMHEAAHNTLDYWSSSGQIRKSKWQKAAKEDKFYITNYAKSKPSTEDIAETIVPWIAVRCKSDRIKKNEYKKIIEGVPNRLKALDESYLDDMRPMKCKDKRKKK